MLVIWVSFACIVWTAALVMLLSAKTRRFSKPLCWAMAGTFPFVLSRLALSFCLDGHSGNYLNQAPRRALRIQW
jgi:hypothetical protein